VSVEQSWSSAGAAHASGIPEADDLVSAVAEARTKSVSEGNEIVLRALRQATVYALGELAGEVKDGVGTESDLLHFMSDDPATGDQVVLLPVFTGDAPIEGAQVRNPEWQTYLVLQLNGDDLYSNVDSNVRIVINPWTQEYQLPSKDEIGGIDQEPPTDDSPNNLRST
ncbi:MAG: SseB family protein, partial [Acidimicrobiales bacterium]